MYDYKRTMEYLIKRARNAHEVIIVGASDSGTQVLKYLQKENMLSLEFTTVFKIF